MIHREHFVQSRARMFARDAIIVPHKFIAFDRAAARSVATREREKARGMVTGTADTLTAAAGIKPLWFEFKAPDGKEPSDLQFQFGDDVIALGHGWSWGRSVVSYCEFLLSCGVPMRAAAMDLAHAHQDAALAAIAKAEARAGAGPSKSRPRQARISPTRMGKINAVRARIQF